MRPFNNPRYYCFQVETTSIHVDLIEGKAFFGNHLEVALNPFLTGEEGRALY